MIWCAISIDYKSQLKFWDKDRGNTTAKGYQEHILPNLHDFVHEVQQYLDDNNAGLRVLTMQDNAPVHTAKTTMVWLAEHGISMFR